MNGVDVCSAVQTKLRSCLRPVTRQSVKSTRDAVSKSNLPLRWQSAYLDRQTSGRPGLEAERVASSSLTPSCGFDDRWMPDVSPAAAIDFQLGCQHRTSSYFHRCRPHTAAAQWYPHRQHSNRRRKIISVSILFLPSVSPSCCHLTVRRNSDWGKNCTTGEKNELSL